MIRPLWEHQTKVIEKARTLDYLALFLEMGTGKTRTTIEIIKEKNEKHRKLHRTLIIAPSVVTFNWKKEFAAFSDIRPEHVIVLHGTGPERLKQLERTPNYFVAVMNFETLLMDKVFEFLKGWKPEIIVVDESQKVKNPKAQRTRRLLLLGVFAKFRYILSGTPVLQNQSDLFSQYLFLDGGERFGKNFFTFQKAWFTDKNAILRRTNPSVTWPQWVAKASRADDFQSKVMSCAVSVKKDECLDLPPYIQQSIDVDMTKDQWKAYRQMKEDYITFLNSTAFTANLAITKALRLAQITSGFITGEDDKVHVFENTPKDKALLELLEDASGKVVVWTNWRAKQAHIRKLLQKYKIEHRELLGDSTALERDRAMQDFHDRDNVRVMLASQAAGGIGVSLVAADKAIYYSRGFSFEHDAQSAARTYRGGSEIHSSIYRIDLVVPDTIDQSTIEALAKKQDVSDALIYGKLKV